VCNHDNDANKIIDICQHYPGKGGGKLVESTCACCESGYNTATNGKDSLKCRVAGIGDVCTDSEASQSVLIKKGVALCSAVSNKIVSTVNSNGEKVEVGK
jgi:hypothetical protein